MLVGLIGHVNVKHPDNETIKMSDIFSAEEKTGICCRYQKEAYNILQT